MIYLDSESAGLYGLPVIIQWSDGFGPVHIENLWKKRPQEVIETIEHVALHKDGICMFNSAFDYFMLYKMWTTLKVLLENHPNSFNKDLEDQIDDIAESENKARDYDYVLKPHHTKDLFLYARKTHYQSTMDRKDIIIKKVPTKLAFLLAKELEKRIPLKDIYFARRKDKTVEKWQVTDVTDAFGDIDPDWKNITVKFKASSALKALAADIGLSDAKDIIKYRDIEVNKKLYPEELGYAPYAEAIGKRGKWNWSWPEVIRYHIDHWAYHERAREYATKDVIYLRELDRHFNFPEPDDDDSVLAVMVAMVRWRGFKIDSESIKNLKKEIQGRRYKVIGSLKYKIPTAASGAKRYIFEKLDKTEQLAIKAISKNNIEDFQRGSTKKVLLEEIAKFTIPCSVCRGEPGDTICPACNNGRIRHEAAIRADEVLNARKADKEEELYDKLLRAGRFHASFKIIGALSSRMAGADKLNAQGIKRTKQVRACFPLAWDGYKLCGGDFDGFEVTIAEAFFGDLMLRKDLLTCEKCKGEMIFDQEIRKFTCTRCGSHDGQTMHGIFGTFCYPPLTYDEIKKTKNTDGDKYTPAKSGFFAFIYGGEGFTLETRLGVPIDVADKAIITFSRRYPNVGKRRTEVQNKFTSLRQPKGIGTKVEWSEPDEKVETMLGFPRYFTLENQICRELFELAQKTPVAWRDIRLQVQRRDRLQTATGAVSSALYAAAFNIQGQTKRAAGNHIIQGTGAGITKKLQTEIWKVQPAGIHKWLVCNMNVHDEVLCVTHPSVVDKVAQVVSDTVESFRPIIPLIMMKWKRDMKSWAEK